jgi:hypothetical protein
VLLGVGGGAVATVLAVLAVLVVLVVFFAGCLRWAGAVVVAVIDAAVLACEELVLLVG